MKRGRVNSTGPSQASLVAAVAAASVAELVWVGPAGRVAATPVVPLLLGETPAVAMPYAFAGWAREVAASPVAALALSDPRMTGPRWQPLAATAISELVEDDDGSLFEPQLLAEELRKYPPSRALAQSPLLRRENWWYLPRLVLLLRDPRVTSLGARRGERQVLLASVATSVSATALQVDTVEVQQWEQQGEGEHLKLSSLAGRDVPADGRSALLLGHDFSTPDMERWSSHRTYGRLVRSGLRVDSAAEDRRLEPIPGLFQRIRRHRDLERGCRRALAGR